VEESAAEVRARVCARLEPRRAEVERAILSRVWAVSGSAGSEDEEYVEALRSAVSAGIDHALVGVERGVDGTGSIPAELFVEARQAARSGVALDVELRRYFAGYTLFCDYVMRAAEEGVPLRGQALRQTFHALAAIFERLVSATVSEYRQEKWHRGRPAAGAQTDRVKRLLAGEQIESGELGYELGDWHVGAVARGRGATAALRSFAAVVDRRLLLVRPEAEAAWAWFGGRRRVAVAEILSARAASPDAVVAFGEPARGIEGWRLTHRQAAAALTIARPNAESVLRYADVGLLASISRDRLLAASLRQLYLAPLAHARDGGAALRETLRAYFAAGRNVSSAASALGVSRQTVGSRLRAAEESLGRTLESCAPELEIALRLEALDGLAGRPQPLTASARNDH
jgi:PucR C-terminal helix-turn-helix domain/GGDEF-like domain